MIANWRVFSVVGLVYIGLGLFLRGFLLTRREVLTKSTAQVEEGPYSDILRAQRGSAQSRRVFLFIIDALRKDFFTPAHFPLTFAKLEAEPTSSHLFVFKADPPTTTSQRLKGMTTGTMPTFVDIGSNFNSSAVLEDSLIHQLHSEGRTSIVMGDDTWDSLFPGMINVSIPMDSFNTRDLDGVDLGVLQNLWRYFPQPWDLMVTHFLGVDHIGHTYHAFHPYMLEKLLWMDKLLVEVLQALPKDAVLFMFGDHGMTDDGNHGGSTEMETESVLLTFGEDVSCRPHAGPITPSRLVNQIDLVPTVSFLLGIPTPYSSIGGIIPELFCSSSISPNDALTLAYASNTIQVNEYLRNYFHIDDKPCDQRSDELSCKLEAIKSVLAFHRKALQFDYSQDCSARLSSVLEFSKPIDLVPGSCLHTSDAFVVGESLRREYQDFLSSVYRIGRDQWTQFHIPFMIAGVFVLGIALITALGANVAFIRKSLASEISNLPLYGMVLMGFTLFHSSSAFSNSFIIEEHWVHFYIIQSTLIVLLKELVFLNNLSTSNYNVMKAPMLIVISLILIRFAWELFQIVLTSGEKFDSSKFFISSSSIPILSWYLMHLHGHTNLGFQLLFCVAQALLFLFVVLNNFILKRFPRLLMILPRAILTTHCLNTMQLFSSTSGNLSWKMFSCSCITVSIIVLVTGANANVILLCTLTTTFFLHNVLYEIIRVKSCTNGGDRRLISWLLYGWSIETSIMGRFCYFVSNHKYDFSSLHVTLYLLIVSTFSCVFTAFSWVCWSRYFPFWIRRFYARGEHIRI